MLRKNHPHKDQVQRLIPITVNTGSPPGARRQYNCARATKRDRGGEACVEESDTRERCVDKGRARVDDVGYTEDAEVVQCVYT
jgi:hypothetical protein